MKDIFKNLITLEMANNHMGDVDHGLKMIDEFSKVTEKYKEYFRFAWKFQLRDIKTFIHPDYKDRTEIGYVKRFTETNLLEKDLIQLIKHVKNNGFISMCTAFDENSVNMIESLNFEIAKVASCSSTDWPLLERVAKLDLPIIVSMAGTKIEDVEKIVSFFKNRDKNLGIMHCVGEYPTVSNNFELNQIDLFKNKFEGISIGFSTHESPDNYEAIKLAIAKGVTFFEKHVAYETDKYQKNKYSASPLEVDNWLSAAVDALNMCGVSGQRYTFSKKEVSDLRQFKRGVFAKNKISNGESINSDNVFFAWPNQENQILANNMSKYSNFRALSNISKNSPILSTDIDIDKDVYIRARRPQRERLWEIIQNINSLIKESDVVIPLDTDLEISHHYGIEKYFETGIAMCTIINREYCKKLIFVLAGQKHPEQYHLKKEETFVVLHGDVELKLNNKLKVLNKGDVITVEPNTKHMFTTNKGCIIEEVSSTHYLDDSYYTDKKILENKNRKTFITNWR